MKYLDFISNEEKIYKIKDLYKQTSDIRLSINKLSASMLNYDNTLDLLEFEIGQEVYAFMNEAFAISGIVKSRKEVARYYFEYEVLITECIYGYILFNKGRAHVGDIVEISSGNIYPKYKGNK